jgi:predicted dehydrogenase
VKSIRANWTSPRTDTNSLWNLAIHDLSICETILGDIPKRKQAVGERHSGELRGVVALMGSEPYYHFEVSNRYPEKLREIRVFGTEGVMVLTDEKVDYISIYNGDDGSELLLDSMEKIHFDSTPPLRVELQVFLDFLNGGVPPETDLEEGIRLIQHLIEIEKLV